MKRNGFGGGEGSKSQTGGAGDVPQVITPRRGGKVNPSVREVSIGITPYGEVINLPLFERHTLVCGQSGSGKSFCSNRILGEVLKIPQELRLVAMIDLKGGTEAGKWIRVADAIARDIEEADVLLTNIADEMRRRERLINSNPQEYWSGKVKPSEEYPLIVLYVDELAVLGKRNADKGLDDIRKHAFAQFDELLFRARSSAICVIACIQRPDASILGGFTRNNFQNRIAGRVGSKTDSEVVFGVGSSEYADASRLTHHWFFASIEGRRGFTRFKTPGELDDSDLKAVALNPAYYADPERGRWLTSEPDTPEALPWVWRSGEDEEQRFHASLPDSDDEPEEISMEELIALVGDEGDVPVDRNADAVIDDLKAMFEEIDEEPEKSVEVEHRRLRGQSRGSGAEGKSDGGGVVWDTF